MISNKSAHRMTPNKENYLKVLLELSDDKGAHSSDVAVALGITKASVSCMMNVLKEEGYIVKEKYGTVVLTEKGKNAACNVKRRYNVLKTFLIKVLGVDDTTAAEDACHIEHIISSETIDIIDKQLSII